MIVDLPDPRRGPRRQHLQADCANCFGLCCVAPAFAASADFALTKPAGRACPHLAADFACGIHGDLAGQGFAGCVTFDCFGAGQQVAQGTYRGVSWRQRPELAAQMFDVFSVMRQLYELLWHLAEALSWAAAESVWPELARSSERITEFSRGDDQALLEVDLASLHHEVGDQLSRASTLVRGSIPRGARRRGADLIGRDLSGSDLRRADLRGAYLLGADLRGSDLALADLLGADLRAADLRGARLSDSLFLTQPQLTAARGNVDTTIPGWATRPGHWPTTGS